jgi:uncharacterized protein
LERVKASPADQRRLLDLADLDARIGRAQRAKANPPHAVRVRELVAERASHAQELSTLLGARDDLRTELSRIESDVEVVEARSRRDAERLAASSNPKQAQSLESEISALARRRSDLEDAELEIMERIEQADAGVAAQEALIAQVNDEGARLSAEGKMAVAAASAELDAAGRDRVAVAGDIPADLLATYDRLAVRGVGAGLLRRGTCEACRMVLSGTDISALRQASDDDVRTCPECGAILVRTEESGL